ncbi:hypothetical protein SDC9_160495 [bioreactor metagenome]|uniref:Uncharacterized protein n=1 Tax=bioreactor metagenome TaxID=1076179 RepID=A0A645FFJ3_9ZZZZ
MGLVEGLLVEPARVLPLKHLGPEIPPDRIIALIAQNRRRQQDGHGYRKVHQACAAHRTHDEQQRIPRQKRHDHHARLDKNDDEEQRIDPRPVRHHKRFKMLVDVQDEVDQKADDFQTNPRY